jgi:hypothetical protein
LGATSLIAVVLLFSCEKSQDGSNRPPATTPPPPPPPPPVFLKEEILPGLPSPYYHFEYDGTGKTSFVSFASDFFRYDVFYDNGRITEMRNNILVNKDRLQYVYNNAGKVEAVNYADSTGSVYTRVNLTYDGNKLVNLERKKKFGTVFVSDKMMSMTYYPDDNLKDLTYHYLPVNGQAEATFTSRFEQYDDKINVDAYEMIHNEFFDHFFLLPGVQLQKNNAAKETRTGDGSNYSITYAYTYNNHNAPVTRNGDMVILNGTDAGHHFQLSAVYSYY